MQIYSYIRPTIYIVMTTGQKTVRIIVVLVNVNFVVVTLGYPYLIE